jgi:hypothetical protein
MPSVREQERTYLLQEFVSSCLPAFVLGIRIALGDAELRRLLRAVRTGPVGKPLLQRELESSSATSSRRSAS